MLPKNQRMLASGVVFRRVSIMTMINPANRTRGGRILELWDYGVSFLVTPFSLGIISPCFGDSNAKDVFLLFPDTGNDQAWTIF